MQPAQVRGELVRVWLIGSETSPEHVGTRTGLSLSHTHTNTPTPTDSGMETPASSLADPGSNIEIGWGKSGYGLGAQYG